ncbi:MAG: hypothetical protein RIS64_4551, partial [Bacteroidota bacterium]
MPIRIANEVKGQGNLASRIAETLRASQIKVSSKASAPVFIIMGPPTTGKDFLASRIAKYAYGSETRVNVLEGGKYSQGNASVWQLTGSDIGFVGSEKEGDLTGPLRQ